MMIKAPWTPEQVDALNRFQQHFHPFTCPGHEGGGDRDLVATRKGWICCHCNYVQDWAHQFMIIDSPNGSVRKLLDVLVGMAETRDVQAFTAIRDVLIALKRWTTNDWQNSDH